MTIRPANCEDLPAMRAIYVPYIYDSNVSFEYSVPTLAQFAERFERITAQFPWLVAEENGVILGYAYGSRAFSRAAYDWCADLSIYVEKSAQRRGVGAALYAALEQRLDEMGFWNLFALIVADNAASIAFHARNGYEKVGLLPNVGYKFGAWHSVVWMMKRLHADGAPGRPPLPPVNPEDC